MDVTSEARLSGIWMVHKQDHVQLYVISPQLSVKKFGGNI